MNALRVLEVLRRSEACSRSDLVRELGLSAPTVTSVVQDLLDADVVEALGEGVSKGGRPPDMIRFKAERNCLVAAQISTSELRLLLTDLNRRELGTATVALRRRASTPEVVCGLLRDAVRGLLEDAGLHRTSLLAVVVGVPGITNVASGVVVSVGALPRWRAVPLRAMLRRVLRCTVMLENDTNLAAMGEQLRGAARASNSFALVSIGTNVSAGIVLNGRLHHGAQWSAGEIGYLRLPQTSRRVPTVHAFGELETMLTISGLLRAWERDSVGAGGRGRVTPANQPTAAERAVEVLQRAEGGQTRARKLVRERAAIVADLVMDLSLILNPELLVLSGVIGSHVALVRSVREQLKGIDFAVPPIVAGELGEEATLWGAIATALDELPRLLLPELRAEGDEMPEGRPQGLGRRRNLPDVRSAGAV